MEDNELLTAIAQIVQAETKPIKEDLADVRTRMTTVESRLEGMDKRLEGVDKRLEGVEDHIGGMEIELSNVKAETGRVKLLLEHDIPKQINILAEGHKSIMEQLPEADELDSLRSRMRTLEHVVAEHTEEIDALKHAAT